MGFGIDSFIEVTSASGLLWRLSVDADEQRRASHEKRVLRFVGACFLMLASYVAFESAMDLLTRRAPEHSSAGIILACASFVVMTLLSKAKRKGRPCSRQCSRACGCETVRILHVSFCNSAAWPLAQCSNISRFSRGTMRIWNIYEHPEALKPVPTKSAMPQSCSRVR